MPLTPQELKDKLLRTLDKDYNVSEIRSQTFKSASTISIVVNVLVCKIDSISLQVSFHDLG